MGRAALEILERSLLPDLDRAWVDECRRDLGHVQAELLRCVARAGLALGGAELAAAEAAARRLVEVEPLRESAHALLMEVLATRGDVAQALGVYESLRSMLREELGAVSGAAVRALGERLLREGRASAEGLPLPAPLREERLFVGRERRLPRSGARCGMGRRVSCWWPARRGSARRASPCRPRVQRRR